MAEHTQKMEAETNTEQKSQRAQKMEKWEKALAEVADLKGKVANNRSTPETKLIKEIVNEISSRLELHKRSKIPNIIGSDSAIRQITSFLKDGSSHAILTIWGMAGIGKTHLADYVYKLHYRDFERSCFLKDIERCPPNGLLNLQKQLLKDIHFLAGMLFDVKNPSMMIKKSRESLTLEVLGSALYNGDRTLEDIIESLGKELNPDIQKVLKFTEDILKACGICKSSGVKILINKCLVKVSSNKLEMHQLFQDMGRDLARQESPKKQWKHSLLWHHGECFDVLKNKKG
ncbi:TMV resistance protein N-like [Rutidosis leptorrhynchoides]|uniref:TMV resistance protein N-like n=1 Tax=Rutidosis leptorrhynchoides TaxID=125765 RepID=UPI003A9919B1